MFDSARFGVLWAISTIGHFQVVSGSGKVEGFKDLQ